MPSSEELIALFGDDFDDVLRGLAQLPPEARELLDGAMGKMLHDADIFDSRVNKAVQTQGASGISSAAISAGLASDMATGGLVFGEIRNTIKSSLVEGINQSGRAGSYQAYDADDKTMFVWVTVAGHKICQDCGPRGGHQQTLKEWEAQGAPGTGWSVCGGHCYCILDPSGKISPLVDAERERAKIVKAAGPLEEKYMKLYKLTPDQMVQYKKFMKLDSSTAQQMMNNLGKDIFGKRKLGTTRAQIIRQSTRARKNLSGIELSIDKHTVNGKITKSRRLVHNKMARELVNEGTVAEAGQAEFLMTGGYPGSGKSTMLNQAFPGWEKKFVHIDSDHIKTLLASHDGIEKLGWRAYMYHDEADFVMDEMFRLARSENRHILFDTTMKSQGKVMKLLEAYNSSGYNIQTAFADLPIEQAMERAIARFLGQSGRFVDPIYILTHGNQNIATFNATKELAEIWAQYNTNVPYKTPALFIDGYP